MYSKVLGFGGLLLIAATFGCGSSSSGNGTGGTSGSGTGGASTGGAKGTGGTNGTGGGSGTGTFSTSVPSGTKLSNISSTQATQLCNDFNTYATNTLNPYFCREIGIFGAAFGGGTTDAEVQAACTAAYNSCLTGNTTTMCDPTMLASNNGSATCTATVGDLTSCLNDSTGPLKALPTCSSLTVAGLAAMSADAGTSTSPASCAPVNNCNGVSTGG